jgi:hypothetical protein
MIVAASAVGLLAVTPLAFAADKNGDNKAPEKASVENCGNQSQDATAAGNYGGLVNLIGIGAAVPIGVNALNCNEINLLGNHVGDKS